MSVALGWIAAALLGADGSPAPASPAIHYHVRVMEMDSLKWRESLYSKLEPVARQDSVTIWTAGQEIIAPLCARASRVVLTPEIAAKPGVVAHFSQRTSRRLTSQLTRHTDEPGDGAVAVLYAPGSEEIRDGCQFSIVGRKLDQGVLARVAADDSRVAAIHQVAISETVPGHSQSGQPGKIGFNVEVPELVKASFAGEWLIPNGGVLLVSLGTNTFADAQGKAAVRERLMTIEAKVDPIAIPPITPPVVGEMPVVNVDAAQIAPLPPPEAPLVGLNAGVLAPGARVLPDSPPPPSPTPALPSRSLPLMKDASGKIVPLPPLPETAAPPTSLPGSSEPCATPQLPAVRPSPSDSEACLDTKSSPASFISSRKELPTVEVKEFPWPEAKSLTKPALPALPKVEKAEGPKIVLPGDRSWLAALVPWMFRLPVTAGVNIEIRATLSPLSRR